MSTLDFFYGINSNCAINLYMSSANLNIGRDRDLYIYGSVVRGSENAYF